MTFTPIEHGGRVAMIAGTLDDLGLDSLIVTDLTELRWLTGFGGSNGWAVVRAGGVTFGTDLRYVDRARQETASSGADVIGEQDRAKLHRALVDAARGERAGVDATSLTHAQWTKLDRDLHLVTVDSPITIARQFKDAAEIERIEAAAQAADAALAEVEPMVHGAADATITEADVRDELEYRMRRHGADDRSYDTIVASGPQHAARPHHAVGRRTIVEGDTVIIDVGALVDGYHSDMTRSYVVGPPTSEQRERYELISEAHLAGLAALADGIAARDVDAASRNVFAAAGYGDWYIHGTGHGVGLQIHESPFHSQASTETIHTGNVVTIEPGLYRDGFGGLRIEDLVVVTADGHRRLTHHPQTPFAN